MALDSVRVRPPNVPADTIRIPAGNRHQFGDVTVTNSTNRHVYIRVARAYEEARSLFSVYDGFQQRDFFATNNHNYEIFNPLLRGRDLELIQALERLFQHIAQLLEEGLLEEGQGLLRENIAPNPLLEGGAPKPIDIREI